MWMKFVLWFFVPLYFSYFFPLFVYFLNWISIFSYFFWPTHPQFRKKMKYCQHWLVWMVPIEVLICFSSWWHQSSFLVLISCSLWRLLSSSIVKTALVISAMWRCCLPTSLPVKTLIQRVRQIACSDHLVKVREGTNLPQPNIVS